MRLLRGRWYLTCAMLIALGGSPPARAQSAQPIVRTNADAIQYLLGIPRAPLCSVTSPSVGTTAAQILPNDPASILTTVINVSANNCFILWDGTVSTSKGIELLSGGGSYSVNVRDDTVLPAYPHWAVCSGSSSSLTVVRCDLNG
jgi:hypothetical protein